MSETQHHELIAWLTEQGHTPKEIDKVMARVAEYDAHTVRESIFEAISAGTIDLEQFVREALGQE